MNPRRHYSRVVFLATCLSLVIFCMPAVAAPPVVSDVVASPDALILGSGPQSVTVSVRIEDPDGDLRPEKTKVKYRDSDRDGNGTLDKFDTQKVVMTDQGGGLFSAVVLVDTSVAGLVELKIRAKDQAKANGKGSTTVLISGPAASFQDLALQSGVLDIVNIDPALDANFAATASAATLGGPTSVSFNEAAGFSTLDFTFDNSFFDDTDFIGAVDPNNPNPWWSEWTLHEGNGSLLSTSFHPLRAEIEGGLIAPASAASCPNGTTDAGQTASIFAVDFPICLINSDMTSDATLTNDHVYLVVGTINVGDGGDLGDTPDSVSNVTLTIEAGVQIFGDPTAGASGIVITRGSDVIISGTREMPVVMSSADDGAIDTDVNDFSGTNEWGGLIIDGFAVANEGGEVLTEAAPSGVNRFFGGTNPADDSGEVRYLVITESGQEFRTDEEVQGLTLEGVGGGTVIEFVQVHHSGDDGVEWFGGTVNAKYLVITAPDDDGLDMDLGFQGGIQFVIVRQSDDRGQLGIESDGNGDNFDQLPLTMPTIANITLIGNVGKDSATTVGALHREGMGGFFHKVIITDEDAANGAIFQDGCLDIDNTRARIDEGTLKYVDSIFNCSEGSLASAEDDEVIE